jgi:uncharacterized membrane protein
MNEAPAWQGFARQAGLWVVAILLIFAGWKLLLVATGLPP